MAMNSLKRTSDWLEEFSRRFTYRDNRTRLMAMIIAGIAALLLVIDLVVR